MESTMTPTQVELVGTVADCYSRLVEICRSRIRDRYTTALEIIEDHQDLPQEVVPTLPAPSLELTDAKTSWTSPDELFTAYNAVFDAYGTWMDQYLAVIQFEVDEVASRDPVGINQAKSEFDLDGSLEERASFFDLRSVETAFHKTRAAESACEQGYVEHEMFKASTMESSRGVVIDALKSAFSDTRWHFGKLITVDTQSRWRFDVIPAYEADPTPAVSVDACIARWKLSGSFDAPVVFDYLAPGDIDVKKARCWVKLALTAAGSTSNRYLDMLLDKSAVDQLHRYYGSDQWNERAGKELMPLRWREA